MGLFIDLIEWPSLCFTGMYKRNPRLQLNDWLVCRRDPNRGTFFKPSSHLLCRKQRGIMTDLHILYVKITPPPPAASVGRVAISDAPSPLTAWPLSLVQEMFFFFFSVRTHHRNQPPLSVGLFVVPLYSQQSAVSPLEALRDHAIVFNRRTHLTQVEPRRRLCVFVAPFFVSCEVTLMGSQKRKTLFTPPPPPPH